MKTEANEHLKNKILELLSTHNKKQLAEKLQVSRQTLYNYMKDFGIDYKKITKVNNYGIVNSGELERRLDLILENKK